MLQKKSISSGWASMCLLSLAFFGLVQHEAHLLLCLEAEVIRAFCFLDAMHGELDMDFASILKIFDGILVAENLVAGS